VARIHEWRHRGAAAVAEAAGRALDLAETHAINASIDAGIQDAVRDCYALRQR
jgi:hypothetical protein